MDMLSVEMKIKKIFKIKILHLKKYVLKFPYILNNNFENGQNKDDIKRYF